MWASFWDNYFHHYRRHRMLYMLGKKDRSVSKTLQSQDLMRKMRLRSQRAVMPDLQAAYYLIQNNIMATVCFDAPVSSGDILFVDWIRPSVCGTKDMLNRVTTRKALLHISVEDMLTHHPLVRLNWTKQMEFRKFCRIQVWHHLIWSASSVWWILYRSRRKASNLTDHIERWVYTSWCSASFFPDFVS